jgi:hypothetical protein
MSYGAANALLNLGGENAGKIVVRMNDQESPRIRLLAKRAASLLKSYGEGVQRKTAAQAFLHPGVDEGIDVISRSRPFSRVLDVTYENAGSSFSLHPATSRQVLISGADGIGMYFQSPG